MKPPPLPPDTKRTWKSGYKNRPTRLPEHEMDRVIGSLIAGGNLAVAAHAINRSERWLQYQVQAFPEVKEILENARRVADGLVQSKLFANAIKSNNVAAQIFWLKNRSGWADRTQIAATIGITALPGLVADSFSPEIETAARQQLAEKPPIDIEVIGKERDAAPVRKEEKSG